MKKSFEEGAVSTTAPATMALPQVQLVDWPPASYAAEPFMFAFQVRPPRRPLHGYLMIGAIDDVEPAKPPESEGATFDLRGEIDLSAPRTPEEQAQLEQVFRALHEIEGRAQVDLDLVPPPQKARP